MAEYVLPTPTSDHLKHRNLGQLTYVERVADSPGIHVFFHGLGLDATDYQEYLETHGTHGVAVSLAGYAPGRPAPLPPVPVERHVSMVADLVTRLSRDNPGKRITLVGFSLGADLALQLAEHWATAPGSAGLPLAGVLLLDPNVNQSTMTLSKIFAAADQHDPTAAFQSVVGLAGSLDGFRSLCTYALKVASKDFAQVQRMARDMLDYWEATGYEQFGRRLARLADLSDAVNVVLSADYETHLTGMREALRRNSANAPRVSFDVTSLDHFGLIEPDFLAPELKALSDGRVA
ncbi:alpha/beta hydrolase [Streptomyces sp. AM 2-1-1]|uniref:alpha/beta fold hydrolase n=1 Tax=unclassified Streptomyces TaxID=2593676 RepID=UPI0023B8999F|nr:alpha/beta hydrolase [Streptomyces sp. AM 2-1-1]WEH41344.1 alpha/beta hydrolase [Streptomyces sp. AM 2-1-1]